MIYAWSGQKGKIEPTIGGKIDLFDHWVNGTVLAYEPGKQLSFTWKPAEWAKEKEPSIVSFQFTPAKSRTRVILKHSGFPNAIEAQSHKVGWNQFVFEPLNTYFAEKE
jgi:uncharacterized protein YndB with AHSA1/START domain